MSKVTLNINNYCLPFNNKVRMVGKYGFFEVYRFTDSNYVVRYAVFYKGRFVRFFDSSFEAIKFCN